MSVRGSVTLWRPTGPQELALVEASGWREWPPRLPDQPIFYPVLNEDYATRIARDWNVKRSGAGFVTRFEVRREFLDRYEVQQAGGETILEYCPVAAAQALMDVRWAARWPLRPKWLDLRLHGTRAVLNRSCR